MCVSGMKRFISMFFALILCTAFLTIKVNAMPYNAVNQQNGFPATINTPDIIPGDVGNHNDYGGGGDFGGGADFGGGGGDGIYFGGSGSSGDSEPLTAGDVVFGVIIGIVVLVAVIAASKRKKSGTTGTYQPSVPMSAVTNNDQRITEAIAAIDENFSRERFIGWTKEVFITLQQAWSARDWSKIRPFEKEELFRQHESQLQEYINTGKINIIERINVNNAYMHFYKRDAQYEYLTVYMSTRMVDYIIDEKTRQILKGDPNRDCFMNYLLTFMRKTGVKTDAATSNKSTVSCPHCGAPVQITSAGKCEYCDFIITTGEHDWVLSNLDSVKPGIQIDNRGVVIEDNTK